VGRQPADHFGGAADQRQPALVAGQHPLDDSPGDGVGLEVDSEALVQIARPFRGAHPLHGARRLVRPRLAGGFDHGSSSLVPGRLRIDQHPVKVEDHGRDRRTYSVAIPGFHLAQCNLARLKAPLDSPVLAGFVAALEPINRLADFAPGFVWRLQTEEGDATALRVLGNDMMLVNMSLWESVEALAAFAYRGDHREVMVNRRQWFERLGDAYLVLWWVPAATTPTMADAEQRLEVLRAHGPSPEAFTFRSPFPSPVARRPSPVARDAGDTVDGRRTSVPANRPSHCCRPC